MHRVVAGLALGLWLLPAASPAQPDLLARMAAMNPDLRTYSASIDADVAMRTLPFLTLHLAGTYYHKAPNLNKVVFESGVPLVASQFDKLYADIEPPSRWNDVYRVTVSGDDGTTTTFRLVPRKQGNIEHIDARADDRSATVTWMRWSYANGGYAEVSNHYGQVDGNLLVRSQTGHVQEPGYTADITSSFDRFQVNVALPDGVFGGS